MDWILPDSYPGNAYCKVCKKAIVLKTMGVTALNSHMKGAKHVENMRIRTGNNIISFLSTGASTSSDQSSGTSTHSPSPARTDAVTKSLLDSYATKNDVLTAEILWTLQSIDSNMSYKSNEDLAYTFRTMFPDSSIAAKYSLGETKSMYLSCYGIAPYFKSLLERHVKEDSFVLLFDESLNKEMQMKQLDIHLRFWNDNIVQSRYFDSQFLGHATSLHLLDSCTDSVSHLGLKNVVQVSMDGPNVNWSFYDKFQQAVRDESGMSLLDTGSCGLHKCHNAFRAGVVATNWQLDNYLTSLYWLLHDVPARREDYESAAGQNAQYPLRFCKHRWLENVSVAQRAIDVLPSVRTFVKASRKEKRIQTKSFEVVSDAISDLLLEAKLSCFVSIASLVEPFMVLYQSDKPMLPFLPSDMDKLIRQIMRRFIKSKTIDEASTTLQLLSIDVTNIDNQKPHSSIDSGFVSEKLVRDLLSKKRISERQALQYHMEVRDFLQKLCVKLCDKAPIKYKLVRCISCLTPKLICESKSVCLSRFRHVVEYLVNAKRLQNNQCDKLIEQFTEFVDEMSSKPEFRNFDFRTDRLDTLYHNCLGSQGHMKELWNVIRGLLLLSHGQATVERGFSTNKEVMAQNLSQDRLISRRIIKDHLHASGGLREIQVTPEMLKTVAGARQKYLSELEKKKTLNENPSKAQKRKGCEENLMVLRRKKQALVQDIKALQSGADGLAEQAEADRDLTLLTKSNSYRKTLRDKEEQLDKLSQDISDKNKELNSLWQFKCEVIITRLIFQVIDND